MTDDLKQRIAVLEKRLQVLEELLYTRPDVRTGDTVDIPDWGRGQVVAINGWLATVAFEAEPPGEVWQAEAKPAKLDIDVRIASTWKVVRRA